MRLGRTDLTVSPIGLGADHFGTTITQEDSFAILDAFLDAGGNFIDTALVRAYQNPHNERLYQDYKEKAELMCCSMQTITLSTMPKLCPFPLIPLTSVKRTEDMADIAEAIDILSR